jgi:restriction system protein
MSTHALTDKASVELSTMEAIVTNEEAKKAQRQSVYEEAVEDARTEIEEHLTRMDWHDFQKLVGELLSAMGYFVRWIAPPGPDGGIDLEVYKDPLGTVTPRIKVQVKHRENKASAKEVRELEGLLRREDDMGLFVSLAGFTNEAVRELRSSPKHIELMDLDRLLKLWQEYYPKVSETGRLLLPLTPVYFLTPPEE